ncbi:MAG: hypothetical protein E6G94_04460 [Alphaproteobacteria bacterium]|nr:MAG: hypothetical protein E6G94_04460 [Alphaproteobacteria bacterium]
MLRALLLLIAVAILVVIGLVWLNVIDVSQYREAKAPTVVAGQAPGYDVKVNPIQVGTTTTNVSVPTVEMQTKQVEVPAVTVGNSQ